MFSMALLCAPRIEVTVEMDGQDDMLLPDVDGGATVAAFLRELHARQEWAQDAGVWELREVDGTGIPQEATLSEVSHGDPCLRVHARMSRTGTARAFVARELDCPWDRHVADGAPAPALPDHVELPLVEFFGARLRENDVPWIRRCLSTRWLGESRVICGYSGILGHPSEPRDPPAAVAEAFVAEGGVDPNARYEDLKQETPLEAAVRCGARRFVQYFLEHAGGVVDAGASRGVPLVVTATRFQHVGVAGDLLAHGADVNAADPHNRKTALHWAAEDPTEGAAAVKTILRHAPDVNAHDKVHHTPLYIACRQGRFDNVTALLAAGALPDSAPPSPEPYDESLSTGPPRYPPLFVAAEAGHTDVVAALLRSGADPNVTYAGAGDDAGKTPLMVAPTVEIVEMLLRHGGSLTRICETGRTPLLWAVWRGCDAIVVYIAQAMAVGSPHGERLEVVNARDARGYTAMMTALEMPPPGALQALAIPHHTTQEDVRMNMLRALLENHGNPDIAAHDGTTALMLAVWLRPCDYAEMLIDNGAAVDAAAEHGVTAFMTAAVSGTCGKLKLLADRGAVVDAEDAYGWTALLRAVYAGRIDSVRVLLDLGASVDIRDRDARTPLHWAAWQGHDWIVTALLDAGADITACDVGGWCALGIAEIRGFSPVAKVLRARGAVLAEGHNYARVVTHEDCGQKNLPRICHGLALRNAREGSPVAGR